MVTGEFKEFEALLKKNQILYVDLKVPDLLGRLRRVTIPVDEVKPSILKEGVGFDSSSYGYSKVESSDMVLIPDIATATLDPFREYPTVTLMANIHLTDDKRTRCVQDVRCIAEKAEAQLRKLKLADRSLWAPEFEFYIFAEAEFKANETHFSVRLESDEEFFSSAYHAGNPWDHYDHFRDEAVKILRSVKIPVRYHHHEVGRFGQQEIEGLFQTLLPTCDSVMMTKYVLFNLAHKHNLFLTFMPKPLFQHPGNGLHLHIYLESEGKSIFYKQGNYANLGKTALRFIGGVLQHAGALCAFTNPSTNSYKRLIPGFESPVAIVFGKANRTSAIRIPSYVFSPEITRFEYRPPDPTCNPYLAMAAILMAGVDGILSDIDPTAEGFGPFDENVPETEKGREARGIRSLPKCLDEALDALEGDQKFLKRGNVFPDSLIEKWILLKREEANAVNARPHPYEFMQYFSF